MSGWATLWIDSRGGAVDVAELMERARQLDEIGALLALLPEVSGVQTFDAARSETQRPRLCVYTTPAAVNGLREHARGLLSAFGLDADMRDEAHDDEPWRETWKRFYRPLVFGEQQLLVRPSFIDRRDHDPEREIVLDPGRAFGTGLHQSTQLCLDRLCELARRRNSAGPARALDVGCGSGVLALAAARLFDELPRIVAIDIDPDAVATAAENAASNGLTSRVELHATVLDDLPAGEPFDLVTANIRPNVLIPLAPVLRARMSRGAHATLSGILVDERARVESAWAEAGWVIEGRRDRETWTSIDVRAP